MKRTRSRESSPERVSPQPGPSGRVGLEEGGSPRAKKRRKGDIGSSQKLSDRSLGGGVQDRSVLDPVREKVEFLKSKGNKKIDEILQQTEDIREIEARIDELINEEIDKTIDSFKGIKDPLRFKIERSKKIAELLINDGGQLNVFLIKFIKEKCPKSNSACHDKLFFETLESLEKGDKTANLLTSIGLPKSENNKAIDFIRATLKLGMEEPLQLKDTRRAVLSAFLMDLRQAPTGSCFTTSVAIDIHDNWPDLFLEDMKGLIENGYIQRTFEGRTEQFIWSTVPAEEIGFSAAIGDNINEPVQAAVRALGMPGLKSEEEITREVLKHVYHDKARKFIDREKNVIAGVNSFDSLIEKLKREEGIRDSEDLVLLLDKIQREENITSIESLKDRIIKLSGARRAKDLEKKNPEALKLLKILDGIVEKKTRFEYKGRTLGIEGVPLSGLGDLIDLLLLNPDLPSEVLEQLRQIRSQGRSIDNKSIEWLIGELGEVVTEEVEKMDFLIDLLKTIKRTRKKSTIRESIEKLAMGKAGITRQNLRERQKLIELSNEIHVLSNQEAVDQQKINRKIEKYIKIAAKLEAIKDQLNYFDKLMNHAQLSFASENNNLLLRGWEYGIGAAGVQLKKTETLFRGHHQLEVASDLYNSFWGLTFIEKPGGLWQMPYNAEGLDEKLNSLIKAVDVNENEKLFLKETFTKQFKRIFGTLFNERMRQQFQYGGSVYLDTTGVENPSEMPLLSNIDEMQKVISGLILEAGVELRQQNREHAQLIMSITNELSNHANSTNFLDHFVRKFANKEKVILKTNEELPPKEELMSIFKSEGGSSISILKMYYQTPIEAIVMEPKNAEDLLIILIDEARALNLPNNPQVQLHMGCPEHAFLFMPNHPSFRAAIDSPLSAEDWVKAHFESGNEPIIFADSNWDSYENNTHVFYVFNKNAKGEIVFSYIIEEGTDSSEARIKKLDQSEWVDGKEWRIYLLSS